MTKTVPVRRSKPTEAQKARQKVREREEHMAMAAYHVADWAEAGLIAGYLNDEKYDEETYIQIESEVQLIIDELFDRWNTLGAPPMHIYIEDDDK